ncbi:substrate-binding periplasmic protein [Desulfovibrio caledoniensis]
MHRSKILWVLLATVLFSALVLADRYVMADRPTRLVCDIWPPYQMETENGYTGLSVDVVRAVYTRMGMDNIEIMALPWKRALDMVRFGDADGLFSANLTPERALSFAYPKEPLFESPWVIWTRKGTTIRSLNDLKGKKIGVVLGYSYTPEFWDFIQTYCSVEEVYSDKINFRKLALGRLDATVADIGNGLTLAASVEGGIHPNFDYEIKRDGLYLMFNKERTSERFVKKFSDTLKAFKQTEEYRSILKKYLGPEH